MGSFYRYFFFISISFFSIFETLTLPCYILFILMMRRSSCFLQTLLQIHVYIVYAINFCIDASDKHLHQVNNIHDLPTCSLKLYFIIFFLGNYLLPDKVVFLHSILSGTKIDLLALLNCQSIYIYSHICRIDQ